MDIKCPHSKLAHKIGVAAVILGILMPVHYVFATMENFEPTGVFRKNTPGSAKVEVYAIGRHEILLSRENARIYDMARLGDTAAQYEFAKVLNPAPHCRDAMPGVAKEAFAWAMRAALKGDAGGENFVGMAYKEGDGVKKDRQKAIEWLTKAAEHGLAKAMCNLAILHNENGDHAKAVPFARKSALNGDSNGQFEWGRMNYHGLGVPVDYKKAVAYLSKAAKQDNPSAMSLMAVCYQLGNGVEKDIPKAINIYENLAGRTDCALQSTLAKVMLAMNYSSSDATDTESLAFKWANAALDGNGEKELRKAGHPSLIASMQYIIGLSYHNGKCVPRNDTLAESWLTKAVGGGNAEAKTVLTKMRSEKYRREQQRLAVQKANEEAARKYREREKERQEEAREERRRRHELAERKERSRRAREILDNAKKEYYREKAEEERIKLYYPEAYDAYKRNHNEYKAWQQQMYRQGYW